MTISASGVARTSYAGNGITTDFTTPKFLVNSDISVLLVDAVTGVETSQVLTTNYTLTGAGAESGTVTMLVAPPTGKNLVIYIDPEISQNTDPVNGDSLNVDVAIEAPLDKLTLIVRRLKDLLTRSILRFPEGETVTSTLGTYLPAKADRLGKYLAFDATTGLPIASAAQSGAPTTAFMTTVLSAVSAMAARILLGTTNTEIFNVKDYGAIGDQVTNDTAAVSAAINAANAADSVFKASTVFFPPGTYQITAGGLPNINCNIYGPGANIRSADATDSVLLNYDDRTFGRSFELHGIFGYKYQVASDWHLPANQKAIGIRVARGEHGRIKVHMIEGLATAIDLDGGFANNHIGQMSVEVQSILHNGTGINLVAGSNIQNEAGRFKIGYFNNNGRAISLTNSGGGGNGLCVNNHFDVLAMELQARDGLIGIDLGGTTVSQTRANTFVIRESLSTPTGTGKFIRCASGILNNYFELPYCDFSLVTMDAGNIFNLASHEINIPGSTTTDARSVLRRGTTPTTGYWKVGDTVWNNAAAAGGNMGWACTASGSPGTWVPMGSLDLQGSATFDPGTIAVGAHEPKDINVTGAEMGDFAICSFSLDTAALTLTGVVAAPGIVKCILANNTTAAVNLGSGTMRAKVIKK